MVIGRAEPGCTQRMAISSLGGFCGKEKPLLTQTIILAARRLKADGRLTTPQLVRMVESSSLAVLEDFLARPRFNENGNLDLSFGVRRAFDELQSRLHDELRMGSVGPEVGRALFSALFDVLRMNLSSTACRFSSSGIPVNEIRQIPTTGATPHLVLKVTRKDRSGETVMVNYLKMAAVDVEEIGRSMVALSTGNTYRIGQVGDWGVSEEVYGKKIYELEQNSESIYKIGEGCGQYLAAAWAFAIVERDRGANNLLIDPRTFRARHIDFEVILCPFYAKPADLASDISDILHFVKTKLRTTFLGGLERGFISGCSLLRQNHERALALTRDAFSRRIGIGFTGHEAGGEAAICITGQRRPLPFKPGDQAEIERRIAQISGGNESTWRAIFSKIGNGVETKMPEIS